MGAHSLAVVPAQRAPQLRPRPTPVREPAPVNRDPFAAAIAAVRSGTPLYGRQHAADVIDAERWKLIGAVNDERRTAVTATRTAEQLRQQLARRTAERDALLDRARAVRAGRIRVLCNFFAWRAARYILGEEID